jgi:hypothetical protein
LEYWREAATGSKKTAETEKEESADTEKNFSGLMEMPGMETSNMPESIREKIRWAEGLLNRKS